VHGSAQERGETGALRKRSTWVLQEKLAIATELKQKGWLWRRFPNNRKKHREQDTTLGGGFWKGVLSKSDWGTSIADWKGLRMRVLDGPQDIDPKLSLRRVQGEGDSEKKTEHLVGKPMEKRWGLASNNLAWQVSQTNPRKRQEKTRRAIESV